jgi:diguanylate cyclase (GGDEF)-like protein
MWMFDSIDSLLGFKRRVYLAAFPFCMAALLAAWSFKHAAGRTTAIEQFLFPSLSVYLALTALALLNLRSERTIGLIERSLFAIAALFLLARFFDILFVGAQIERSGALADLLYWIPLVYVIAHLAFNRSGTMICTLFLAILICMGLPLALRDLHFGTINDAFVLSRFYLGNIIYIVLFIAFGKLKELYVRAESNAHNMAKLANTDPLVGLPNRRQLQTSLTKELERAKRFGRTLSVVFFDLDQFKRINDAHGHDRGDAVLRVVATLVKQQLRPSDEFGRWGGDEFLVIAPELNATDAALMANRVRGIIAAHDIDGIGNATASFGVAAFPNFDSLERLLQAADRALARTKASGRNGVEIET